MTETISKEELYGRDAQEWVSGWDQGRSIWSIEMGGLGPGYEQAIQVTAVEIVRHLLERQYDAATWGDSSAWQADRRLIETWSHQHEPITKIGLSGAQWGAALSLATAIYKQGPAAILADPTLDERHIQVSKTFPWTP